MSTDPRDPRDPRKNSGASAPHESYPVLQKLAYEVIAANPGESFGEYLEALKTAAARHHIPYNGNVIGGALASAMYNAPKRKRI